MSAPFKVLVFSIVVVVVLVLVVLFKFDLLQFTSNATNTTSATSVAQTVNSGASSVNNNTLDSASASQSAQVAKSNIDTSKVDLENGKKLYDTKTCIMCHGADGKSNTPMGKAVMASDLTAAKFKKNSQNLPRLDYIIQVIENGVPGTAMTSFKSQLPNEQDRIDLAAYVNSLQTSTQ